MINKIGHYSLENHGTIYDEEAMTALELAGRTASKVNECVDQVNENTQALPGMVAEDVERHIKNGDFDRQVDKYAGDLSKEIDTLDRKLTNNIADNNEAVNRRIDNMLNHIPEGGTTMDAEVVDIRLDAYGTNHSNAGKAVRETAKDVHNMYTAYAYFGGGKSVTMTQNADGSIRVLIEGRLTYYSNKGYGTIDWDNSLDEIMDYVELVDGWPNERIITVPAVKSLVYNTRDKRYYMRNNATCDAYDILLLENSNGNPIRGTLVDEWKYRHILANTKNAYVVRGAYMYMGSTARISFVPNTNTSGMDITFHGRPTICYGSNYRNAGWTDAELAPIKSRVVNIDGNNCTIQVPGWSTLCYNHLDNTWRIRSRANLAEGDIVAMSLGYCQVLCGTLMDEWCVRYAQDIQSFLDSQNMGLNPPDAVKRFAQLFTYAGEETDTFMYFTDPHLCEGGGWETEFQSYMTYMKAVFDATPVDFVVCGGDWLGNSDTQAEAFMKLGVIAGQMREAFGKYYPVVGNHDYNYQGYAYEGAEPNTGTLYPSQIANLWMREKKHPYYTFDGSNTRFFVFDTGVDWYPELDDYKHQQIAWFVDELLHRDTRNMAVFLHIYMNGDGDTEPEPLASAIMDIIEAYNNRGSYSVYGATYSFADATGYVRFVIAGHNHADEIFSDKAVPVIEVTDARDGGQPSFDLCLVDYEYDMLHLVRVGTGEDRSIDISL